jgi:hypothetical protein
MYGEVSTPAYGTDAHHEPDEFNSFLSAALNQSSGIDPSQFAQTDPSSTATDHLHQVLVQHLQQNTGGGSRQQSLPSFNDLSSSLMAGTGAGAGAYAGAGSFVTPVPPKPPRKRSPENSVAMLKRRWGYTTMQRCLLQIHNTSLKEAWAKWAECIALHTRNQLVKLRQQQSRVPALVIQRWLLSLKKSAWMRWQLGAAAEAVASEHTKQHLASQELNRMQSQQLQQQCADRVEAARRLLCTSQQRCALMLLGCIGRATHQRVALGLVGKAWGRWRRLLGEDKVHGLLVAERFARQHSPSKGELTQLRTQRRRMMFVALYRAIGNASKASLMRALRQWATGCAEARVQERRLAQQMRLRVSMLAGTLSSAGGRNSSVAGAFRRWDLRCRASKYAVWQGARLIVARGLAAVLKLGTKALLILLAGSLARWRRAVDRRKLVDAAGGKEEELAQERQQLRHQQHELAQLQAALMLATSEAKGARADAARAEVAVAELQRAGVRQVRGAARAMGLVELRRIVDSSPTIGSGLSSGDDGDRSAAVLVLKQDIASIGKSVAQRQQFCAQLQQDMSDAMGGGSILQPDRIVIESITAGSIIVKMRIKPASHVEGELEQLSPQVVVAELKRQLVDSSSAIYQGQLTRHVDGQRSCSKMLQLSDSGCTSWGRAARHAACLRCWSAWRLHVSQSVLLERVQSKLTRLLASQHASLQLIAAKVAARFAIRWVRSVRTAAWRQWERMATAAAAASSSQGLGSEVERLQQELRVAEAQARNEMEVRDRAENALRRREDVLKQQLEGSVLRWGGGMLEGAVVRATELALRRRWAQWRNLVLVERNQRAVLVRWTQAIDRSAKGRLAEAWRSWRWRQREAEVQQFEKEMQEQMEQQLASDRSGRWSPGRGEQRLQQQKQKLEASFAKQLDGVQQQVAEMETRAAAMVLMRTMRSWQRVDQIRAVGGSFNHWRATTMHAQAASPRRRSMESHAQQQLQLEEMAMELRALQKQQRVRALGAVPTTLRLALERFEAHSLHRAWRMWRATVNELNHKVELMLEYIRRIGSNRERLQRAAWIRWLRRLHSGSRTDGDRAEAARRALESELDARSSRLVRMTLAHMFRRAKRNLLHSGWSAWVERALGGRGFGVAGGGLRGRAAERVARYACRRLEAGANTRLMDALARWRREAQRAGLLSAQLEQGEQQRQQLRKLKQAVRQVQQRAVIRGLLRVSKGQARGALKQAWAIWRETCDKVNRSGRVVAGCVMSMERHWLSEGWRLWSEILGASREIEIRRGHDATLQHTHAALRSARLSAFIALLRASINAWRAGKLASGLHSWAWSTQRAREEGERSARLLSRWLGPVGVTAQLYRRCAWLKWRTIHRREEKRFARQEHRQQLGQLERRVGAARSRAAAQSIARVWGRARRRRLERAWELLAERTQLLVWAIKTIRHCLNVSGRNRCARAWALWREVVRLGWASQLRERLRDDSLSRCCRARQVLFMQALLTQGVLLMLDWLEKGVLRRGIRRWWRGLCDAKLAPIDIMVSSVEVAGVWRDRGIATSFGGSHGASPHVFLVMWLEEQAQGAPSPPRIASADQRRGRTGRDRSPPKRENQVSRTTILSRRVRSKVQLVRGRGVGWEKCRFHLEATKTSLAGVNLVIKVRGVRWVG